jgi:hypothetical protein
MARVYVETTIPSYYFETRTSLQVRAWKAATRHWWRHYRSAFDLVTSQFDPHSRHTIGDHSRGPAMKPASRSKSKPQQDPVVREVRTIRKKLWDEAGGTVEGYLKLRKERAAIAKRKSRGT